VIQNVTGAPSQALQVIFETQSQGISPKRAVKKIRFCELQNTFFLHFDPPIFKPHNFFYFLFILNDLKCYRNAT
jgi:hypothetical protein